MTEAIVAPLTLSPEDWRAIDDDNLRQVAQATHTQPRHIREMLGRGSLSFMSCAGKMAEAMLAREIALPPNLVVLQGVRELMEKYPAFICGDKRGDLGLGIDISFSGRNGGTLDLSVAQQDVALGGILRQNWKVTAFAEQAELHIYDEFIRLPDEGGYQQELRRHGMLTDHDASKVQLAVTAALRPELRVVTAD